MFQIQALRRRSAATWWLSALIVVLGAAAAPPADAQQWQRWSGKTSPAPDPQPPSHGGGNVPPSGHHHHHRHAHGYPFLYGYYPSYYGAPYGVYCPSCGRWNCLDPYCRDGTFYYVLPPRVTTHWPWGSYTYGGYGALPRVANGGWNQGVRNDWNLAAAAAERAAAAARLDDALAADVQPEMAGGDAQRAEILRRVMALRPSTAQGRQTADRVIAEGDRIFADQNYRRAAAKYREAIARAADYPEPHFRAGHAYVATGDYQLAVNSFLIGLQLAGSVDRPGFTLEDLYRGDRIAKQQHLDALTDAALRQPEDGGLPFLMGVAMHYDGQPLQAREFFERAGQLPGAQRHYAAMFLPVVPVAEPAP